MIYLGIFIGIKSLFLILNIDRILNHNNVNYYFYIKKNKTILKNEEQKELPSHACNLSGSNFSNLSFSLSSSVSFFKSAQLRLLFLPETVLLTRISSPKTAVNVLPSNWQGVLELMIILL